MKEGKIGMAIIQFAGHKVLEFGPHKFIITVGERDYVFDYKALVKDKKKIHKHKKLKHKH